MNIYALGALILLLGLRCSESDLPVLGKPDEPASFDSGVDDMPREAKSMLGKSVVSEDAFFGGWGRFARSSVTVGLLLCAAWSGGGPGGCTSLFAGVEVGSVGIGTDRALARVWRTCPLWN